MLLIQTGKGGVPNNLVVTEDSPTVPPLWVSAFVNLALVTESPAACATPPVFETVPLRLPVHLECVVPPVFHKAMIRSA